MQKDGNYVDNSVGLGVFYTSAFEAISALQYQMIHFLLFIMKNSNSLDRDN